MSCSFSIVSVHLLNGRVVSIYSMQVGKSEYVIRCVCVCVRMRVRVRVGVCGRTCVFVFQNCSLADKNIPSTYIHQ